MGRTAIFQELGGKVVWKGVGIERNQKPTEEEKKGRTIPSKNKYQRNKKGPKLGGPGKSSESMKKTVDGRL